MTEPVRQTETLWDVADVARYLKVSESTIRARVLRGEIPYKKVGSLVRFRREEIDAWVEQQTTDHEASIAEPAKEGAA